MALSCEEVAIEGGEGKRGYVTADTTNRNKTLCSVQGVRNPRDPLKPGFQGSAIHHRILTVPRNNTFSVSGFAAVRLLLLRESMLGSSASHRP